MAANTHSADAIMTIDNEPAPSHAAAPAHDAAAETINVNDEAGAREAVAKVLHHRKQGWGKLIGMAGMPRHGKTVFAQQVQGESKFGPEEIVDYKVGKTYGGYVNFYYLPGQYRQDVLIDLAGEDFQEFGRYRSDVPLVMKRVLWETLPHLDALIVFVALPILWDEWSRAGGSGPSDAGIRRTEVATDEMIESTTLLLRYALVAKELDRARKERGRQELTRPTDFMGPWAPTRQAIDGAFKKVAPLDIPVFFAFSKADVCAPPARPHGLTTPPLPPNAKSQYHAYVHPDKTDPLVLGMEAFPKLYKFLSEHVRYFKFDFLNVIRDRRRNPDPLTAPSVGKGGIRELCGAASALEFVAEHGWRLPAGGTAKAVKWARRAHPERWNRDGKRQALGETWDADVSEFPPELPEPPEPGFESEPDRSPPAPEGGPFAAPAAPAADPIGALSWTGIVQETPPPGVEPEAESTEPSRERPQPPQPSDESYGV